MSQELRNWIIKEKRKITQEGLFDLIIDIKSLVKLIEARLKQLGLNSYAKYIDPILVAKKIEWC